MYVEGPAAKARRTNRPNVPRKEPLQMFTINHALTESQRNGLRSLCRSQAGFPAWRAANGYDNASLKVSQICEAINHFGLETEANKIMAIVPAVIPAGAELQAILDEPAAAPAVAGQAF